jgi:hypothetical protein
VPVGRQLDLGLLRRRRVAGAGEQRLLVAVNYAPNRSQCRLRLSFNGLAGRGWRLRDLLGDAVYDRDGDELSGRGLYLEVGP